MSRNRLNIDTIRILGIDTDVKYRKKLTAPDGDPAVGLYHDSRNLIELAIKGSTLKSQLSTLVHEVFESWDSRLELNLEHNQISSLETAMFSLFADNEALLIELLDKLHPEWREHATDLHRESE